MVGLEPIVGTQGSVTVSDGSNVVEGAVADAAVVAGAAGTISAKLRAISRDLISNIVLAVGNNHIGQVGGHTAIAPITFTLDTSAYASGDLIADTQELASALRVTDGTGVLQSITINDKSDQGVALKIVILSANRTLGTENSAPTITDDHGDDILGIVPISASDWLDLGGTRVASIRNIGLPIKAVSGGTSIYVAIVNDTGTPTYAASGLVGRFGILQD